MSNNLLLAAPRRTTSGLPQPASVVVRLEAQADRLWTDSTLATPVSADGDLAGAWRDTAGATQIWAESGTRRPTWRTSAMEGGRACVEFTQADADRLAPLTTVPTHSGARSVLVEFELTTALTGGQYAYVYATGDGVSDGGILWLFNGPGGESFSVRSTGTGATVGCGGTSGAGLPATGTRCLFTFAFDGVNAGATGSYTMRLNGVTQTPAASFSTSVVTWGVGADPSLVFPYATPMRLRRLLIWNVALTAGELAAAEAYCT